MIYNTAKYVRYSAIVLIVLLCPDETIKGSDLIVFLVWVQVILKGQQVGLKSNKFSPQRNVKNLAPMDKILNDFSVENRLINSN